MTLDTPASMAAIAAVVAAVTVWGIWFSSRSSRYGPAWALSQLQRWRPLVWVLALIGAVVAVAVDPVWLGVAIIYIAAVTGWLTRTVRVRLETFRRTYGEFDTSTP